MKRWIAASLIGAMVAGTAAQAQTSAAAPQDDTTVSDVTVVGGKIAPTTEDPKSATCEFLVATDPMLRAQIQVAQNGGDPFIAAPGTDPVMKDNPSAILAPTIYQPTRFPVNVDPGATPLSPPGSALPEIGRQYLGITARSVNSAEVANEREPQRLYGLAPPVDPMGGMTQYSADDAIGACRFLRTLGSPSVSNPGDGNGMFKRGVWGADWAPGKYEIAYRDKSLPMAFALFEDHRYAESLGYFEKGFAKLAYDQGGDEAALMIGKLYLGAPGVERDMTKAVAWLTKAAGARFDPTTDMPIFDPREPMRNTAIGEAAMILGQLYAAGAPGLAKDPAAARKWFDRARFVGHVRACLVLGDIYYYGRGAPRDLAQAFQYYKQGAVLGDAPAQQALAEMYSAGEAPGGRDLKLAAAWHNEAAKIGHAPSLFALASAYERGEGVAVDPQRALGLYKLAAAEGSAPARNALGTYFYEGRMVPKDPAMARRWFEQAAFDGDPDAMFNLGAMMMKGEGGSVDRTHAWAWLKLAQAGQNAQAPAAVQALERRMTAAEKAEAAKLLGSVKS
jgi:TPR repeat protein